MCFSFFRYALWSHCLRPFSLFPSAVSCSSSSSFRPFIATAKRMVKIIYWNNIMNTVWDHPSSAIFNFTSSVLRKKTKHSYLLLPFCCPIGMHVISMFVCVGGGGEVVWCDDWSPIWPDIMRPSASQPSMCYSKFVGLRWPMSLQRGTGEKHQANVPYVGHCFWRAQFNST